jgi:curved DNA-binding protein CbpA
MQSEQDLYNILGIAPGATIREIRQAYRKLAFQYHPDRNQMNPAANKRMEEINEAFAVISDPVKRKEYDIPRGYRTVTSKFKRGMAVKVNPGSNTPYRGRTGVVNEEPAKDTFRFWYMVKFESQGFAQVSRFPEEELSEVDG